MTQVDIGVDVSGNWIDVSHPGRGQWPIETPVLDRLAARIAARDTLIAEAIAACPNAP